MYETSLTPGQLPSSPGALVFDRYRLERRLGSGGFGTVWLAHDETLERQVAVKVVPRADPPRPRGEREALAAARLNHPGIVALYEAGADEHAHYLVSELVEGATLHDLMREGALSDRDVVRIGLALCDALGHAHDRGVIHRDVKPQNVVVPEAAESAAGIAKLTDFGVARLVGDDALTRTGDVIGTLAYMAPEQAEGELVDAEADLYALGVVLYEALSGSNPVRAGGAAATARRLGSALPSLRRARRRLPPVLTAAIDRAVRPRPEQRGTIAELGEALSSALPLVSDREGTIALDPGEWELESTAAPAFDLYEQNAEPLPVPGVRRRMRSRSRAVAAATAAGLAAGVALALGPAAAGAALPAAVAAALLVALLPRAGWLLGLAAIAAALLMGDPSRPGTALLGVLALGALPLALPRRPALWSLPAAAPALGLAGLAGAFPAVAGMASPWRVRLALGAAGFWTMSIAELIAQRTLFFGRSSGTLPASGWEGSGNDALHGALWPVLSSGALVSAALWGLAALALPLLVRGFSFGGDVLGGAVWAGALAGASLLLGASLEGAIASTEPRGAITGAALGATWAVAVRAARRRPADAEVP